MELSPEVIQFISTYGYIAIFFGSMIEGDVFLIVASFLSYLGKLDLPLVMTVAFFGTWFSDLSWFFIGRYSSNRLLEKWRWLNRLSSHSVNLIGRKPRVVAASQRFMYGLRIIVPFSLGKTKLPTSTYIIYSAGGVALWVLTFTAVGYFFANLTETIFGRMKHLEIILPTVILITLFGFIYASHIIEYALKIYPKRNR